MTTSGQVALAAALTAAGLVLAGCGDGQAARVAAESSLPSTTSTPSTTSALSATSATSAPADSASVPAVPTPPSNKGAAGRVVTTADSEFGPMLFDRAGQAIYHFDRETTKRAECYGACAQAWPPVLTDGAPRASGFVRPGLLGTVERKGGATQVTYAGHPLYYYVNDGPGQVLCHNVREYGGLWLVVTPAGTPAP